MSENAVPQHEETQLFTKEPVCQTPSYSGSPRQPRRMPLLAVGMVASALVLLMFLALDKTSIVYALITPPHTPDFTAVGEAPLNQFGFSVASAGDINDDGYGDVVVGADLANKFYVYAGSMTGLTSTVFYSDTGTTGESFGHSVAGGGDVNNDGVDDIVVGAPISSAGAAYVYYGSSVGLPTRGATLTGELNNDRFGWSVAIIGDVNNDNLLDAAIGAPQYGPSDTGRVYIFHGPLSNTIPATTANTILDGENPLDGLGVSVAGAGDVNGDGIDDLVVGAWKNEDGGTEAGKAYVFYGSGSGIEQSNFTSVIGGDNDKLGTSVSGAGDVNGDGFADVIIGADATNPGNPSPGYLSVYPGGLSGLITTTTLFTRQGESNNDRFGFVVSGNGDLDGDGFSDLAVGAYDFGTTGKAYAYAGCGPSLTPSLIFSSTGDAQSIDYGRSLAIVRDVNGDQLDDLVVGDLAYPIVSAGKIFAYYGVEGGCQPAVELVKTVGLANYPAIYTNTSTITVPTDAIVRYRYSVRNSGNVTLTQQSAIDNRLGIVTQTTYTLIPGASYSASVTGTLGANPTPGISITNVATWTSVVTTTNRTLSALAVASARVNVSGPTTDQDGDGILDNEEGSKDVDTDGIPDFLDPDNAPVSIGGLSINAPAIVILNQPVNFTAVITAGTNVSYTWDFGDEQTATTSNPTISHIYTQPGFYVVTLTATNSLGTAETTKSIRVRYGSFVPFLARFYFFTTED